MSCNQKRHLDTSPLANTRFRDAECRALTAGRRLNTTADFVGRYLGRP
jgi:hypothetical protein